jgi:hypothetical protein
MGGKGGDGGGGGNPALQAQMQNQGVDLYRYQVDPNYMNSVLDNNMWDPDKYDNSGNLKNPPTAAAAPAPAPVAAPAAVEAPAPAAPVGDPGPPKNDTLAPSVSGGSVDAADPAAPGGAGSGVNTDTAGSTLGGSILNPPKYWTGNASKFKSGSASKGKMTTTQT